ncbi:MAG: FtsX-like permease family protein, partial [Acidobacteriota bacterium]
EHRARFAQVYARLPAGLSRRQAEMQLAPWFEAYLQADVQRADWPSVTEEQLQGHLATELRVMAGAHGQSWITRRIEQPLAILMGACGLVLLLACLNVANLSLARAYAGRRATALRTALGASKRRILGESMIESAVLALLGTGLGALTAPAVSRFTLTLLLDNETGGAALRPELDLRALLFALGLTVLVTLLSGAAPALFTASMRPIEALRQHAGGGGGSSTLRKALVIGQFTLALVLLVGAGLFARTLGSLRGDGPGYATSNLLMFRLAPAKDGNDFAQTRRLIHRVRDELGQQPEISAVGVASFEMLSGGGWNNPITLATATGRVVSDRSLPMNAITPGFFAALGVPLLHGRDFRPADATAEGWGLKVAIVSQELVDRYLGGENPIGDRLAFGTAPDADPDIEIVGVVRSFQDFDLRQPEPQVFFPLWQVNTADATFYLRTDAASDTAAEVIRQTVKAVEPALTVFAVRTVDDQLDRLLVSERVLATLASTFAVLATLLAVIGLYGVLAFSAERRKKEMGIRLALGAPRWSAGGLIVREALALVALGLALALPIAWALGRLVESQLFGIHPMDPATITAAIVALLAVSLGASALPAVRVGST